MSSDSMLIHAGARQLEEHLLRRPRLACTPCANSPPMIRRVRVVSGH
jgi:hypothetical protein